MQDDLKELCEELERRSQLYVRPSPEQTMEGRAAAAIARLSAKYEALAKALKPFADCAEQIADTEDDEEWAKFRLLIKHYRQAAKALEATRHVDAANPLATTPSTSGGNMTDLIERAKAFAYTIKSEVPLVGAGRGSYAMGKPTGRELQAAAIIRELIAKVEACDGR